MAFKLDVPQRGQYYYHYKHDPKQGINHYAYYVVGIAKHTETDELMVVYKTLYFNDWMEGLELCVRPVIMWSEQITKDNYSGPRFRLMTSAEVEELKNFLEK